MYKKMYNKTLHWRGFDQETGQNRRIDNIRSPCDYYWVLEKAGIQD